MDSLKLEPDAHQLVKYVHFRSNCFRKICYAGNLAYFEKMSHVRGLAHSVEIYFRKKGMQVTATTMGNSLVASTL
jgi:hypothetical protein